MPSRRSHTKSRKGCLECKRRHIKCDEELPKCTLCRKRKLECSYPPNSNDLDSSQGSPAPRDDSESTLTPSDDLAIPNRMVEMRLMHQYLTSTHLTLARDGMSSHHLAMVIPRMATSFPYLLDSILALTALHLATVEPENHLTWLDAAVRYQSHSCSGMGKVLPVITPEHYEPAFMSSIFIMLFAIGFSGLSRANRPMDPIAAVLEVRTLITGCAMLFNRFSEVGAQVDLERWSEISGIQECLEIEPQPDNKTSDNGPLKLLELHKNLMNSLMRLLAVIDIDRSPNQPVYKAAWDSLHQAVGPWPRLGDHGGVISWPFLITEEFISLAQNGHWIARILFLHYSVAMRLWGNRWYVRDWGRRSVLAILNTIDEIPPHWAETISWIKEGVEIND
ncbi:hypothetical protein N7476_000989 [Penicillium atrosanguineum]|uniref:Zn(2)-C6 fungal-type domain-containing protein n=1 Tax=Penicillium atrosanguineum TaxID=1132637 RepID=A0A9W9UC96_9EURO|nr:hypothetical protein N7476_000989 [Penicillium atrosanguineum]